MKYLKRFESKEDDIEKFINNSLTYLTDVGFTINCTNREESQYILGELSSTKYLSVIISHEDWFTFSEIVDDFIPFLTLLKSKYRTKHTHSNGYSGDIIIANGGGEKLSFLNINDVIDKSPYFDKIDFIKIDILL